MTNSKLSFSGHETFSCRQHWLKKGYDFLINGGKFSNEDAVVKLGVGKNMVLAMKYWLQAFYVLDDKGEISEYANYFFGKKGRDPYLEDIFTIWLLHYLIITNNSASLYNIFFKEFVSQKNEFTKSDIVSFTDLYCSKMDYVVNSNSLIRDVDVFIQNYVNPENDINKLDDIYSNILADLNLITVVESRHGKESIYRVVRTERRDIPDEFILFAICDKFNKVSIEFKELYDFLGDLLLITHDGLLNKINSLADKYSFVSFEEHAGIRNLHLKSIVNKFKALDIYYDK
ncbi:MAG: DUF4007 family protein [Candidatus Margulisbacteria bacterium]|nr:DUF4007 family protein [Candidatus Margulisiibacteriota bacterium]